MPPHEATRYAEAVYFAVVEGNLTFGLSDEFAHWWATSGWMFHREIADGFANWVAGVFPRDDE
jgi:hypothetical protein